MLKSYWVGWGGVGWGGWPMWLLCQPQSKEFGFGGFLDLVWPYSQDLGPVLGQGIGDLDLGLTILETSWGPFPYISQVWNELIMAECRWSFLLINTAIELFPAPSLASQMPESSDECDCFDLRLTLLSDPSDPLETRSWIVPWDIDVERSMIYAVLYGWQSQL